MKLLEGKLALITGASKGIGRATAVTFAQAGANLVIAGRDEEALAELAKELEEIGSEVTIASYDVTDPAVIKANFQTIIKKYKKLDILVNNAGMLEDALMGMISTSQIENTMATNLNSVIHHMQLGARLMQRQKSGSIINVSSIIGRVGNAGQVVYGASKAGVIGASLSAAKELAQYNIRVNSIAPGFIETDMARQLSPDKFQERMDSIAMKRIGQPEEVAQAILFLASDMASYVTGQVIGVDGGMLV